MKAIYEEVGFGSVLISAILAFGTIYFLYKTKYFRTLVDPSVQVFFQISFTLFLLLIIRLIDFRVISIFVAFLLGVYLFRRVTLFKGTLISEEDWVGFTYFFLAISIFSSFLLLYQRGFILFSANQGMAKVSFYQGAGLFKRINEIAAPLVGVSSIYFFKKGSKIKASFLFVYSLVVLLSLGSKSGLISSLFFVGAYFHFYTGKIFTRGFMALTLVGLCSVVGMFYLIYGNDSIDRLYFRVVAFADGPYYFFKAKLQGLVSYPLDYPLDQVMVNLRLKEELSYLSLGPKINKEYFGSYDPLFGPNPQFIVESIALLGGFAVIYSGIVGVIFSILRNSASNPFSFIFLSQFFNPLLIDSQYAFSNLFTLSILFFFMLFYTNVRGILKKRTTHE